MPIRPCPACDRPTLRPLEGVSRDAEVFYYRCERCGNVWTVQKSDPDGPASRVTLGPCETPKPKP